MSELPVELAESLEQVKVVDKSGKPVTIDNYDSFMQFLIQASQLSQIVKIRKYFDDRTSKGLIQTWGMDTANPLTITDTLKEIKVDFPAQSFSLINDGLNTVYVWVNTTERPKVTVKSGAKFEPNYETHKINYIYLQCATGESASVRIVAKD